MRCLVVSGYQLQINGSLYFFATVEGGLMNYNPPKIISFSFHQDFHQIIFIRFFGIFGNQWLPHTKIYHQNLLGRPTIGQHPPIPPRSTSTSPQNWCGSSAFCRSCVRCHSVHFKCGRPSLTFPVFMGLNWSFG